MGEGDQIKCGCEWNRGVCAAAGRDGGPEYDNWMHKWTPCELKPRHHLHFSSFSLSAEPAAAYVLHVCMVMPRITSHLPCALLLEVLGIYHTYVIWWWSKSVFRL